MEAADSAAIEPNAALFCLDADCFLETADTADAIKPNAAFCLKDDCLEAADSAAIEPNAAFCVEAGGLEAGGLEAADSAAIEPNAAFCVKAGSLEAADSAATEPIIAFCRCNDGKGDGDDRSKPKRSSSLLSDASIVDGTVETGVEPLMKPIENRMVTNLEKLVPL